MNNDKLIGYMTYYFRVENDTQIAYTKIHTDFRKLPRFMFFNRLKKKVADVYKETGMKVTSVNFCSEKEYEENKTEDIVIEREWHDGIIQSELEDVSDTNVGKINTKFKEITESPEKLANFITDACEKLTGTYNKMFYQEVEFDYQKCKEDMVKHLNEKAGK